MKISSPIFCSILLLFVSSCNKSSKITISGTVNSINRAKVRVVSLDYKTAYDSTIVKNNKFQIVVSVPKDGFYYVEFSGRIKAGPDSWNSSSLFYAENKAVYKINWKNKAQIFFNNYIIQSTSFTQTKLSEFYRIWQQKRDSLIVKKNNYGKKADEFLGVNMNLYRSYCDSINLVDFSISTSFTPSLHQFMMVNTNTFVVPYFINEAGDLFDNYFLYKKALDSQNSEVKKTDYYKECTRLLASVKKIKKGARVPQLYGNELSGEPLPNNLFKNKLTLLSFWASYCQPCMEEMPDLKQLYAQYKSKGFNIVGVSIDENAQAWKQASARQQIPWENICEVVEQRKSKNIENFVVKAIPVNYLINNKGEIITRDITIDSLKRLLVQINN